MHYNTNRKSKDEREKGKKPMKAVQKMLCLLTACALVLCGLAGCGKKEEEKKALVMATNANFPPYEYKEGENFEGIDVEIAQKIAEKMGRTLEIEDVEFGSIVSGVESGKYDIGMAGMTVNEERLQSVNFTSSYATGIQVVIVKEDSAITSIDDLYGEGILIGVQQDTTGDIYSSDTIENGGFGADKVVQYKNGADAVQALITGKVSCVIIDNEPAKSFVKANTGLKILSTEYVQEDYAIAVNKSNTELLEELNKILSELTADGTVQKIVDKYIPPEAE